MNNCKPADRKTYPNALLSADQLAALGGTPASGRYNAGANDIFCDGHAKRYRPTAVNR